MNNADFLAEIDLFQELPLDLCRLVAEFFETIDFEDDEVVFRVGDPSRHIFVVKTGAVVLFSDRKGEVVGLKARVEPGGVFGEVGVLQGSGRTLSARSSGSTTLLRLSGASLLELAHGYDSLALKLSKTALTYSFENRSSQAELARRREARVRIGCPAELRMESHEPLPIQVENLSMGGVCLSGLPEGWDIEKGAALSIGIDPATALFSAHGRVAWRKNDRLGIAFTETPPDHELRIAGALHRLLGRLDIVGEQTVLLPQVEPPA
ncbi:MAG: cyclic nucleotide-binding domain-containing protein [bacterium]|nr:cyclic nucleotide-binding domain-containing protein [bacterium]